MRGDLASAERLAEALARAKPDRIFHLAAQNNIGSSFADPRLTVETNVVGSANLLEATRLAAPAACFVSVGSSAEYGLTANEGNLLGEDLPLLPTSPYGITKVSQGHFCRVYANVYELNQVEHADIPTSCTA